MFFSENGVFRYTLPNTDENEQSEKSYDITFHALPRFFHTQFDSGVKNIQLIMDKTTELQPNNGRHVIETSRASMVYWFEGGSHVSVYVFEVMGAVKSFANNLYRLWLRAHYVLPLTRSRRWICSSS
jgi:hypothetical protein